MAKQTPFKNFDIPLNSYTDGIPLICDQSECNKYSPVDDSWTQQPKAPPRSYAATGYMENLGLIMAGGQEGQVAVYQNELYTTFDGTEFTVS